MWSIRRHGFFQQNTWVVSYLSPAGGPDAFVKTWRKKTKGIRIPLRFSLLVFYMLRSDASFLLLIKVDSCGVLLGSTVLFLLDVIMHLVYIFFVSRGLVENSGWSGCWNGKKLGKRKGNDKSCGLSCFLRWLLLLVVRWEWWCCSYVSSSGEQITFFFTLHIAQKNLTYLRKTPPKLTQTWMREISGYIWGNVVGVEKDNGKKTEEVVHTIFFAFTSTLFLYP